MFMHGTQLIKIAKMVPGHEDRLKYLLQQLVMDGLCTGARSEQSVVCRIDNVGSTQTGSEKAEIERIVEGFQAATPRQVPKAAMP